jgi:bifunctional enzyme CysN/CysC
MSVIWLTGRSGAGKSTIARHLMEMVEQRGGRAVILDGDEMRSGLCSDLGFSDKDRHENIRRIAAVAKLMTEFESTVIVSVISPFRSSREAARALFAEGEFFEVYVDTPHHVAEMRDVKGLYKRARLGEIPNFTGIDSDYEPPEHPELHIHTTDATAEQCAQKIVDTVHGVAGSDERREMVA